MVRGYREVVPYVDIDGIRLFFREMSYYVMLAALLSQLTTVDTLLGSSGGSRWLLGMLCEVEEGHFHLEDLNSHVALDLSHAVSSRSSDAIVLFKHPFRASLLTVYFSALYER